MDFLRPLGATGMRVSAIGLGTVKLGRTERLNYPAAFSIPSDEAAADVLATAADLGITLIDTAPAYGTSEARLGELMKRHDWFGGRDRWVVSTKVGEEFENAAPASIFLPPRSTRAFNAACIALASKRSISFSSIPAARTSTSSATRAPSKPSPSSSERERSAPSASARRPSLAASSPSNSVSMC